MTLRASHQICLNDFKQDLRINDGRHTLSCLIIKFLATQLKFLDPSSYCTVINYSFTFYTNIFWINKKYLLTFFFFRKCKHSIIRNWFIAKIITVQKYALNQFEVMANQTVLQPWTDICNKTFCSWKVQNMLKLQKNMWYIQTSRY